MKMKIAILGSTGSIGKSTIKIIKDNPKNFDVVLLTANNNYKELAKQANELKAKNLIINIKYRNIVVSLETTSTCNKTVLASRDHCSFVGRFSTRHFGLV